MKKRAEKKLQEKTKKISIIEGSFYGVYEGAGVRYIAPFALAIGKNNPYLISFIALLNSVPPLIGNISQLYAHEAMRHYTRKRLLLFFSVLQSFLLIGILLSGIAFFVFGLLLLWMMLK